MKKDNQKQEKPYSKMTIDELTALAEQGDAEAQCRLAYYYEKGKGVEKDSVKGVEWYTKAAEQGHSIAQCNLAACYKLGNGVTKDLVKAVKLYKESNVLNTILARVIIMVMALNKITKKHWNGFSKLPHKMIAGHKTILVFVI